jgi:uncharacterized protein (TIGR03083 family)
MTEHQTWVALTYNGLADLLASAPAATWDAPSLCEKWQVRHVIAHMTMPARLTPEQFGAEMAAAGRDFAVLNDTVAARDASLPEADHLEALRSQVLQEWQPPGGGAAGALSHAVIHSLDVTIALDRHPVAPNDAVVAVLDQVAAANGAWFGVDLTGVRLEATNTDWSWGNGEAVAPTAANSWPSSPAAPCPTAARFNASGSNAQQADGVFTQRERRHATSTVLRFAGPARRACLISENVVLGTSPEERRRKRLYRRPWQPLSTVGPSAPACLARATSVVAVERSF